MTEEIEAFFPSKIKEKLIKNKVKFYDSPLGIIVIGRYDIDNLNPDILRYPTRPPKDNLNDIIKTFKDFESFTIPLIVDLSRSDEEVCPENKGRFRADLKELLRDIARFRNDLKSFIKWMKTKGNLAGSSKLKK